MSKAIPVPGTGRRVSCRHQFRRPRNISVKRLLAGIVGSLRGMIVPPSSWDDLHQAAAGDRTWKRYRRTQWKARELNPPTP